MKAGFRLPRNNKTTFCSGTGHRFSIMKLTLVILVLAGHVAANTLIDGVVHIECGTLEDNLATITYFGDSRKVSAYMQNGRSCPFVQNVATATWSLTVSLYGNDPSVCSMAQVQNRHIYSIEVISRRNNALLESENDEKFLLECNFDPYKEEQDVELALEDPLDAPTIVDVKAGMTTHSNFTIELIGIEGQTLTSVTLGRVVHLKVTQKPSEDEEDVGFEPVMCDVMTPDEDQSTPILTNGCGTGYPFARNRGFEIDRTVGISPPFRMFRLHPLKNVNFKCTFVTCQGDCVGSSCAEETFNRPRRQVVEDRNVVAHAVSKPQSIVAADKTEDLQEHMPDDPVPMNPKILPIPWTPVDSKLDRNPASSEGNKIVVSIDENQFKELVQHVRLALLGTTLIVLFIFVIKFIYIVTKLKKLRY